jgi:hypothetical protein
MYITEGDELLTVADESNKELVLSVGQDEIDTIVPRLGSQRKFRIGARRACVGSLDRLDPRASTSLPHPALSCEVGGPLAVKAVEGDQDSEMRLVEPRFKGVITLSPEVSQDLGVGEQGYAMLGLRRESIGQFAWVRFHRWIETLLRPQQS